MTTRDTWCRATTATATILGLVILASVVSAQSASTLLGASGPRSVTDGVYTADQARRGREQYRRRCLLCHQSDGQGHRAPAIPGESLEREGDKEAPPIAGDVFLTKWNGQTAKDLFEQLTSTMPVGAAGSLRPQEYADVLAYLFEMNKFPAGSQELTPAREQLALIAIRKPAGN